MSFLSRLFGQKQDSSARPQSGIQQQQALKTTRPDFEFYQKVVDVVVVYEALKNDLNTKLKQAFENPKSFYNEANDFILSERGLTYPQDALLTPKFVFVDTLQDNNQMTEVDWKSPEIEVRGALNRVLKGKNYEFAITNEKLYNKNDTFETLQLIDSNELKPAGYSLQILDIGSDSYVCTIVPLDKAQEVNAMFGKMR
jgi:hypothetical protein